MKSAVLSLPRFRALAAAYGSDIERWPERDRELARRLIAESESARSLLATEEGLDALLAAAEIPPLPPTLEERLARIPTNERTPRPLRLRRRALLAPALGWAAAAAVGLWLGVQTAAADQAAVVEQVDTDDTAALTDDEAADAALADLTISPLVDLEELP